MGPNQNVVLPCPPVWSSDEEAFLHAEQLASLALLPMSIKVAAELDVFEIIAKAGPGAYLSPGDISERLPIRHGPETPATLDRLLRMLAGHNVLTCRVETGELDGKVERKYGAAPVVKFLAKNQNGDSMAPLFSLALSKAFMDPLLELLCIRIEIQYISLFMFRYCLKDAILHGGIPFDRAHGMSLFEFTGKNPSFNMTFNEAMRSHSTLSLEGILDAYKGFDDVKVLVDVGGRTGGSLDMILKKHPHIKGICFDLPHVVSTASEISGIEHMSGDMFERVPSGDTILLKWILHDWADELCVKLLKNCWEALEECGKVVVVERCLTVQPENTMAAQCVSRLDLCMFLHLPGRERTLEEFRSLAMEAGFSKIILACSYASYRVIEFRK
ncbi:caffeic acid 3-O-methyltransferase-like [Iris pallida]|uniref:Caffeic acid 3-O-methyltransferase-like n=1 Tax=Iris pallida TaxID=29817 RepID=A0AAX6DNK2_IRIPA|nr:caffeic acid 3-O-methyltransferase-like [Iris pallida]